MPTSPWTKGDQKPLWRLTLGSASDPLSIVGLTTSDFKVKMKNISNGVITTGTWTFSALAAASGSTPATIDYQVSPVDVATPSMNEVTVVLKEGTVDQRTFKQSGVWSLES